jgi:DNA polymerase III delta subunit
VKLALILDKTESFLNFQKERIMEQWNIDSTDTKVVEKFSQVGGSTLFGTTPCAILHIGSVEEIKQLIITSTVSRQSTKKLEKIAEQYGTLIATKTSEASSMAEKLVSELHLTSAVREFLLNYVGNDYNDVLPLVRTLETLTPKQQSSVTEADLYARLPKPEGALPPWDIERPLLNGSMDEIIRKYRRIVNHTHPLVIITLLRNKFQLAYRISAMDNPSAESIAAALGVSNNYSLKIAQGQGKKLGLNRLQKIVETIEVTENALKGASAADNTVLMEKMLITVGGIIRNEI